MTKAIFRLLVLLLVVQTAWAGPDYSTDSRVLFTVADKPVTVADFHYVYTKNNIDGRADYSKTSVNDYLQLYKNFHLKVKEAETLGMDTLPAIVKELNQYRSQLAQGYLVDQDKIDELTKEAYERLQEEIRVSHILFRLHENAKDTAEIYQQAMKVRKQILRGEPFEMLASHHSEDPSVKDNLGDIGYITAFKTVYPFESAAYQLKVDEISMPVRTKFGYHLVKAYDRRKAQGEVEVAHLFIKKDKPNAVVKETASTKINRIYNEIYEGKINFDAAVAKYSEDKKTINRGGLLERFGVGKMEESFETAAFNLQNVGDVSRPVQTDIGWHILQLKSKKGIEPYNQIEASLRKRVQRSDRTAAAKGSLIEKLKAENDFIAFESTKTAMYNKIDNSVLKMRWKPKNPDIFTQETLFRIGNEFVSELDFISHLKQYYKRDATIKTKEVFLDKVYQEFVEQRVIAFEEAQLDKKYPDFKALMGEYHDGILLFELTDDLVWSKAAKDTTGLRAFYEANKQNYMWQKRAKVHTYTYKSDLPEEKLMKAAKKGKDKVLDLNKKSTVVTAKTQLLEAPALKEATGLSLEKGFSAPQDAKEGFKVVHHVEAIEAPQPKKLSEVRGYVVSDYQKQLEKDWIAELKQKYPIQMNETVLQSIYQ